MWGYWLLPLLVSFIILWLGRSIAIRFRLFDKPNYRKHHQGVVPIVGGLALFAGNALYYLLHWKDLPYEFAYLLASIILLCIGLLDDRFDLRPRMRAIIQISITCFVIYMTELSFVQLGNLFGLGNIDIGYFSWILTIIIMLGVISAFNMIDGIDGLLASTAIVFFSSSSLLMFLSEQKSLMLWCFAFVAILLIYLLFNLNILGKRKKVFMGEVGSTLIGFSVVWLTLIATQSEHTSSFEPITALWLIAVPLFDMITVIIRRLNKGNNIFTADRLHIHHIIMDNGLNSRHTLLIITLFAWLFAIIGIYLDIMNIAEWIRLIIIALCFMSYYRLTSNDVRLSYHIQKYRAVLSRKK